jgi:uncharacterized membrane protein
LVYVPSIATFLGDNVVLPGQIWRLAWPIPLAALLALGWLAWEATGWAVAWVGRFAPKRLLGTVLPLLVVVALTAAAVPPITPGLEAIQKYKEEARLSGYYPVDPIYPWFREEITSPAVVLAQDLQGARIPAYSSEANVVSRRGSLVLKVLPELERRAPGQIDVPEGALDVHEFFHGTDFATGIKILRRYEVDYVMVPSDSRLSRALDGWLVVESVAEPSYRYDLYSVNLQKLGGPLRSAPGEDA